MADAADLFLAPATKAEGDVALLIEGWRGLNHSYGLVNQYQILELMQLPGVRLFHHDLPYFNPQWTRAANGAGFPPEAQQVIDALPPPGTTEVDCVYRIGFPVLCGAEAGRRRTLTFMVTEMGLAARHFSSGPEGYGTLVRDANFIVTPSRWSRDRIAGFGFPEARIRVIPHGVDTGMYRPLTAGERAANRAHLGIGEDETVFANVGGALWNKGADLLLRAFAALRQRGRRVRLILKDQRGLYGLTIEQIVRETGKACPALLQPDTMAAISVIAGNLGRHALRSLYCVADCYVSPYRAEGFNLPVLEAIACGTRVIVTSGGATDDFCPEPWACRIPGRPAVRDDLVPGLTASYIEPDLEALIAAMDACGPKRRTEDAQAAAARAQVLDKFTSRQAAQRLLDLARGGAG